MRNINHYVNNDESYKKIVYQILHNEEFDKLKKIGHHGNTRYDHCLKVSYYSYKIAKTLKLDYREVARAGLLHDFFISTGQESFKEKLFLFVSHPKKAEKNASDIFDLSEKESNIIISHMFPLTTSVPKYFESWVVNIVDKTIAAFEFSLKFKKQIIYSMNLYVLFFINFMK